MPRSVAVVFGGLGMSRRALARHAAVYAGRATVVVPLTLTCLAAGARYTPYRTLHDALSASGGAPLHVHSLSGSCHYIYRFVSLYPEHRARVVSQLYDSPCHAEGAVAWMYETHGVPRALGRLVSRTVLADTWETATRWNEAAVFARDIPTGLVTSTRDAISPTAHIDTMMSNWGCTNVRRMQTDSAHVRSLCDHPERYARFCRDVADAAEAH